MKRDYGKETSYGAAELTETEKNAIIKQEKAAKEAARRAKEYSGNWTKSSLSETVAKLGLDKKSPVNEKEKTFLAVMTLISQLFMTPTRIIAGFKIRQFLLTREVHILILTEIMLKTLLKMENNEEEQSTSSKEILIS